MYPKMYFDIRNSKRMIGLSIPIILIVAFLLFPEKKIASSRIQDEYGWAAVRSGVLSRLSSVFFADRNRGWAAGSNGTLLVTADGGEKWKRLTLPERQQKETVRDLWLLKKRDQEAAEERLCLLGEYAMFNSKGSYNITDRVFVLQSGKVEDAWEPGITERQPIRRPDKILGRIKVDESGKVQVSEADIYQETHRTPEPLLLRMFFANEATGWACGESGVIQTTRDGGLNWKLQFTQTRKLLLDVMAVDPNNVWIVGAGGTILRTENGGQVWLEQKSGVSVALRTVWFADARRGWAAGVDGTIISTADGGAKWTAQKSNVTQTLNSIFFLNASDGWAAGDKGVLLRTRNGGETWEDFSIETHANLSRLFFVAPDLGWVVGGNGVIYKYSRLSPDRN